MGKPAARVGDMHMCPMVTPAVPPVPHVGGPITGPGVPTVLIGGMPAATMSDMCVCVGPPDTIVLGSTGVFIGGKPAARMGDMCAHGGAITVGLPTVLIGEVSGGGGAASVAAMPAHILSIILEAMPPDIKNDLKQIVGLKSASEHGQAFAHEVCTCPICSAKKKK